ncbi:MAG: metallophosphoesterase [Candidatus Pacearchaeota archaeon]
MKILVFSDTHLTSKFDQEKFNFLWKIIDSSDQVIINGDFWDGWFTNFDGFLKSKWNGLFPLLLEKNTIYIYGNHDPAIKCDHRTSLFSVKAAESYTLSVSNKVYFIEHGHRILNGKRTKFIEIYGKLLDWADKNILRIFLHRFLHFLEYLGYKCIGASLMTELKIAKQSNEIMKQFNNGTKFLICGDTHCAEMDKIKLYANSGCILYGKASYLMIDNGQIILYKEDY